MDWIKKHYDKALLIFLALALVGSSALLVLQSGSFKAGFEADQAAPPRGDKLPAVDTSIVDSATELLDNSPQWGNHAGSVFVSEKYLIQNNVLVNPLRGGVLHPPVPNDWFEKNDLDLLNKAVLSEDPDGDGFTNLEEWKASTNPRDKNLRPAYSTKLALKKFIKRPFRLKFAAYTEDSYQINTLDLRQPSQFLKLGEPIAGTKFKVLKFTPKKMVNESTQVERDVSELTIQNIETSEEIVLVLETVVDSPDSFALFSFTWDGSEFGVKKGQKFTLKVEPEVEYKLIDIRETEAVITNLKSGESQIKIPLL